MDGIIAELIKLGVAGIFLGYLILQNRAKDDQIADRDKIIHELQEKRVAENRELTEVVRGNMTALTSQTQGLQTLLELVRRSK